MTREVAVNVQDDDTANLVVSSVSPDPILEGDTWVGSSPCG